MGGPVKGRPTLILSNPRYRKPATRFKKKRSRRSNEEGPPAPDRSHRLVGPGRRRLLFADVAGTHYWLREPHNRIGELAGFPYPKEGLPHIPEAFPYAEELPGRGVL